MIHELPRIVAIGVVLGSLLVGCAPIDNGDLKAVETEEPVVSDVTWEEAKARTQAMELEIAALMPAEVVVGVDQIPKGTLFSCSETEWTWYGATTVTVVEGTEIEPIVKAIEAHYTDSRFDLRTRLDIAGAYEVQLMSPETAETYIVAEDVEPTQIRIASGSECFTLPEDVWPGGDF